MSKAINMIIYCSFNFECVTEYLFSQTNGFVTNHNPTNELLLLLETFMRTQSTSIDTFQFIKLQFKNIRDTIFKE